ncbi:unnamed protein product [Musa hybrid cultivar]
MEAEGEACWNWEKNKAFEITLAAYTKDHINPWEKIAAAVPPGTKLEEFKHHHKLLSNDVNSIESGVLPLPNYTINSKDLANDDGKRGMRLEGASLDSGRAQAISSWTRQVRQGRLAKHIEELRVDSDADAGGKTCAQVLPPTQLSEHMDADEHS